MKFQIDIKYKNTLKKCKKNIKGLKLIKPENRLKIEESRSRQLLGNFNRVD